MPKKDDLSTDLQAESLQDTSIMLPYRGQNYEFEIQNISAGGNCAFLIFMPEKQGQEARTHGRYLLKNNLGDPIICEYIGRDLHDTYLRGIQYLPRKMQEKFRSKEPELITDEQKIAFCSTANIVNDYIDEYLDTGWPGLGVIFALAKIYGVYLIVYEDTPHNEIRYLIDFCPPTIQPINIIGIHHTHGENGVNTHYNRLNPKKPLYDALHIPYHNRETANKELQSLRLHLITHPYNSALKEIFIRFFATHFGHHFEQKEEKKPITEVQLIATLTTPNLTIPLEALINLIKKVQEQLDLFKSDKNPIQIYKELAFAFHAAGYLLDAILAITAALTLSPEDLGCLFDRAKIWRAFGNLDAAIKDLQVAINYANNFASAHYLLAELYYQRGLATKLKSDFELAKVSSSKAEEKDPNFKASAMRIWQLCDEQLLPKKPPSKKISKEIKLHLKFKNLWHRIKEMDASLNDTDVAYSIVRSDLRAKISTLLLRKLSPLWLILGATDAAYFKKALSLLNIWESFLCEEEGDTADEKWSEEYWDIRFSLARFNFHTKNYKQMLFFMNECVEDQEEGDFLEYMEIYELAEEFVEKYKISLSATLHQETTRMIPSCWAIVNARLNQTEQAIATIHKVIKENKEHPHVSELYLALACLHVYEKNYAAAENFFAQCNRFQLRQPHIQEVRRLLPSKKNTGKRPNGSPIHAAEEAFKKLKDEKKAEPAPISIDLDHENLGDLNLEQVTKKLKQAEEFYLRLIEEVHGRGREDLQETLEAATLVMTKLTTRQKELTLQPPLRPII